MRSRTRGDAESPLTTPGGLPGEPRGAPDALLDGAPCGFVSFADDGTITLVNATLLELLGYERAELVGRHVESVLTLPSRIFYQTHLFPLVTLHGRADEIYLTLRAKGGEDLPVLLNAARTTRGGAAVTDCVLVVVRQRGKYEAELLAAKKAAEAARAESQAARQAAERVAEQLEAQALELEQQTEEARATAEELEQANQQLQVAFDVAERARQEAERAGRDAERAQREAERANAAKSQFLAVMSHELRTPLNAIGGYAELLEMGIRGAINDAQREDLDRIRRSQRHLLGLINDLLNYAKLETGAVQYDVREVPAAGAYASAESHVLPQARAKGLRLSVRECPPDLVVRADAEKLQQILVNLLSNAVKFTERGGSIDVRCESAGDRVLVHVHDSGIGIPADKLEAVFEPFVQVHTGLTRANEGTGLGLAISRELARAMGGDLRVESRVGEGSTFTLALPRTAGSRV